jgi:hypothetical protein
VIIPYLNIYIQYIYPQLISPIKRPRLYEALCHFLGLGVRAVGRIPIIPMISHTVGRKTTLINGIEPLASAPRRFDQLEFWDLAAKPATIGRFINSNGDENKDQD